MASGRRGFCVFLDKYQIGWNVRDFLNACSLVFFLFFLQLWLAYLEFLSSHVHKTCIFNHQYCWALQDWKVSSIVCPLCVPGQWLLFCGYTLHNVSAPYCCGSEVQIHVIKRVSLQSLLQFGWLYYTMIKSGIFLRHFVREGGGGQQKKTWHAFAVFLKTINPIQ